jgi:D-lyxose ketol-isomerase
MIVKENQITPIHFHWSKMEDIINRGCGNLMIKLYNSTKTGELATSDVEVSIDGVKHIFPAGYVVRIKPGQSITLTQGLYHRFWGEEGFGTVIVSEVSMCNDDTNDNRFYDKVGRFPKIEEDEEPLRLLCNEYKLGERLS